MVTRAHSSESLGQPDIAVGAVATAASARLPRPRMSTRNRLLFFLTAWLIVLMPFLFWWSTWFGRQLAEAQIGEYLRDEKHPRHIQHALVQVGEHMSRHETGMTRWYPELVRLSTHPVEEVRNTDAWVMGQDTSGAGFHDALLKMLADTSPTVRGNAALSLVRFGDAAGRPQIVALLRSARITAPVEGRVVDADRVGTSIRESGLIAKIQNAREIIEVRSPTNGRIGGVSAPVGTTVTAGADIATVEPAAEQVWEALRALYLVGRPEDLDAVRRYERDVPEFPGRVRDQARLTDRAIRERAAHPL